MLEVIKPGTKVDFASKFKITTVLSVVVVLASLALIIRGLNYGVDFKGGAEVLVHTKNHIEMGEIRDTLSKNDVSGAVVQSIGEDAENNYLIKVPSSETDLNQITEKVRALLESSFANQGIRIDKVDIVGPKAGEQLRISGFQAMLYALIAIMIYIGLRFDFKYSPGAIVALFHDVIIVVGIFGLLNHEFTLQIVAALLAIIGYSVNDTVVIYDRVREHEERNESLPLKDHINNAASETLSRTFLTSSTTLFVSLSMYFFGGESIKEFFFAISLGVIIGTYSSLFVAAPVTLFFDRMMNKKETAA